VRCLFYLALTVAHLINALRGAFAPSNELCDAPVNRVATDESRTGRAFRLRRGVSSVSCSSVRGRLHAMTPSKQMLARTTLVRTEHWSPHFRTPCLGLSLSHVENVAPILML
jgi:hypothetical protein